MSLLMDALKRAEKARQAEAERAKAEHEAEAQSMELSLDPLEERTEDETRSAPPAEEDSDAMELTAEAVRREIEAMEASVAQDAAAVGREAEAGAGEEDPDGAHALSLDYADIPLDDTQATLPSMKSAQRSVQDYFDGTRSQSLSMDDVREAIDRERAAAPPGAGEEAPREDDTSPRRQAQSFIQASSPPPPRGTRTVALGVAVLFLLVGAGGALFAFKDPLLALLLGEREPLVARPAPAQRPPAAPETAEPPVAAAAAPREAPQEMTPAPVAAPSGAAEVRRSGEGELVSRAPEAGMTVPAPGTPVPDEPGPGAVIAGVVEPVAGNTGPVGPGGGEGGSPPVPVSAAAGAQAPPQAAAPSQEAPAAPAPPTQEVALEEVLRERQPQGTPLAVPPGLQIKRTRGVERAHRQLLDAYQAYLRGDDAAAMAAYRAVLARAPNSRDALLGVAAVHMRAGAYEEAAGYYLKVLQRNPGDSVAQAALLALGEERDPVAAESRIKRLLSLNPRDPYLQFSLGNLFAQQQRWMEAQRAYFGALRDDPDNPDYAFNLAVSLDRLGQGKAALVWYRRARELATARPAAFDDAGAARRIAALDAP